ncbi:MAG: RluA family pseudouridine synthase [Clostridiales bacterium]|nr:RluA family pseudouridine synthase [Clostridiales bacterium]
MEEEVFVIENGESQRLDVYLAFVLPYTRSYIKNLVDGGNVTVNGQNVKCGKILKTGDVVSVCVPPTVSTEALPEDIPLDILYEDSDLAVINKQRGISVHPSGSIYSGTLVNALLFHLKELSSINGVIRPGIVHRLDKDTTGVMVVAKNDKAHLDLSKQISERTVIKKYIALLEGNLPNDEGNVTTNIARSERDRKLMAVTEVGRKAITDYKVLERFTDNCLVEFRIHTGRTHQIRVHAKYLQHPVVGDLSYGYKKQKFNTEGQLLHSHLLTFRHPTTREEMTFTAPLPDDFMKILTTLRKSAKK